MEAGRAAGHPHPAALLPPRPEPGRLLPRVHRGREGHGLLHGLVQLRGLGRDGGPDQLARDPPGPPRHRRAAAGQPSHGLPDLRARRQLRTAEPGLLHGRAASGSSRASASGSPSRTPATRWSATPRSASSAAAACGSAPKSRACTTSASTAAASTPSSRPPTARRWTIRSASSAASASTSAPPPPSWRSAAPGEVWEALADPEIARGRADGALDPRRHRRGLRPAAGHARHRPDGHRPAAAGLRRRVRHQFRRRPDDRRGGPRVPHAGSKATARCR